VKDLLEIALSGFWSFVGSWVLLSLPFDAIRYCWKYWLRSRNIKHHGWPPPHLDADGDFAPQPENEDEDT
jgi:hypothetical protein